LHGFEVHLVMFVVVNSVSAVGSMKVSDDVGDRDHKAVVWHLNVQQTVTVEFISSRKTSMQYDHYFT